MTDQCNYCNGQIIIGPDGKPKFYHDETCMCSKDEYGSENDDDSEDGGANDNAR